MYVTSNDLLKIAIKYEENVIAGRAEEIRLGLKDPFVTVGELPGAVKRGKSLRSEQDITGSPSPRRWREVQDDQPAPKLWEPEGTQEPRERSEMRRGIEILNKKIGWEPMVRVKIWGETFLVAESRKCRKYIYKLEQFTWQQLAQVSQAGRSWHNRRPLRLPKSCPGKVFEMP